MEYKDDNRGIIQFRNRARQIINFSGLRYGKITPMDIDGYMDWRKANVEIFLEMKHRDATMSDGQRYAYEKLVDDGKKAGTKAFALVCEHSVDETEKDVDAASTLVREYYDGNRWHVADVDFTCKQFVDVMWRKYGK